MEEKTQPLVSVLLPVYNQRETIIPTLNSILAQTYQNIEILILDDASTDGSDTVIRSFVSALPAELQSKVRHLRNETNVRLQKNLNRGLREARGELIARIDGDDQWAAPNKLERQVDFLITHPDYALIGGGAVEHRNDGTKVTYPKPETDAQIRAMMLIENPFWHGSVVFRKDALPNLGYLETARRTEDYELWMRIGLTWKMHNLPEVVLARHDFQRDDSKLFRRETFRRTFLREIREQLTLITRYRDRYPHYLTGVMKRMIRLVGFFIPKQLRALIQSRSSTILQQQNMQKISRNISALPQQPLVSVLLTVFNQKEAAIPALQSVLDQTYNNVEILILDDASTDGSESAIHQFTKTLPTEIQHKIRYLRNETNLRLQRNLNRGLNEARGELIARINGDDKWTTQDRIALQVNFLVTHPEYGLVGGWFAEEKSDGSLITHKRPESDEQIRSSMLLEKPIGHACAVFRKDALPNLQHDETATRTEDYDLWMRIGQHWKMYNIQKVFLIRHDLDQNDSKRFNRESIRNTRLRDLKERINLIFKYRHSYPRAYQGIAIALLSFSKPYVLNRYRRLISKL